MKLIISHECWKEGSCNVHAEKRTYDLNEEGVPRFLKKTLGRRVSADLDQQLAEGKTAGVLEHADSDQGRWIAWEQAGA